MRLALQTDFALRTLMYLAVQGRRAKVAEVAEFYGISAAHVAKAANQLARLGHVRSLRGPGGGLELTRPPEHISIGAVVTEFERNLHLLECVGTDGVCLIERFCKLKRVLAEAERIQLEYLNDVTLADVVPTRRQVARVAAEQANEAGG